MTPKTYQRWATPKILHFLFGKHKVCQLTNEYGKAKKRQSPTIPHNSFSKNRIMDSLVARAFFPRALPPVRAVFLSFFARWRLFPVAAIHVILLVAKTSTRSPWSLAIASSQPLDGGRQRHHGVIVRELWRRHAGEGVGAQEKSLRHTKTPMPSLVDFCIYAWFDPSFAKLPNLPKLIAKPLESNFWAFFQKTRMPNSIAKA